jgi:hypothetical protein
MSNNNIMKPNFLELLREKAGKMNAPVPAQICSWCNQPILEGEQTIKDESNNDAHLACVAPTEGQEGYTVL